MSFAELSAILGSWGEFVGAIAVVVTLIYLAIQIRQNTRSLEMSRSQALAQTSLAYITLQTNTMLSIAASDEISALREKALKDWGSLTPTERLRINNVASQQLIHYSLAFGLTKGGHMNSSTIDGVKNGLSIYLANDPIARRLWPRIRGYAWDSDMAEYVDRLLEHSSETPKENE